MVASCPIFHGGRLLKDSYANDRPRQLQAMLDRFVAAEACLRMIEIAEDAPALQGRVRTLCGKVLVEIDLVKAEMAGLNCGGRMS